MTRYEKIGLILVAVLAITVLALIPDNPVSREQMGQPSPVDWDQVVDDQAQPVALVWQGIIAHVSGQDGSWIQRNLETRFNLELQPLFFDLIGYQRRRPLLLSGGEIPDIMWDGDPLGVRQNLRNGFIMELPYELILKHAPTYVKFLNRYGREAWLYAHHNGRNYGLPTFFGISDRPRIGAWRMDWLRQVGIDRVPETIAEMHEALYRFRHNDPNGDGRQNTYGWNPQIGHWSLMFAEIFAAYDVLAFDLMEQDGQVVWGGILPEAQEALRTLNQWYREGLIDPDFILDAQGGAQDRKFINGRVGYHYPVDNPEYYDPDGTSSLFSRLLAFQPDASMVPGPPLRNAEGVRRGRTWGGAGHVLQFGKHLEQQPAKVIRILEMMETIARDEELYMQARYGKRDQHWSFSLEGGITLLEPYLSDIRLARAELLPGSAFFFPSAISEYEDAYLKPDHHQWLELNRNQKWGMMNVLGKSDVVPSAGRYLADLRNFQLTAYAEMVVGTRDIEAFDAFVADWRRRGGDVLLEEANAMQQTMQEILQRVGGEQ